jgi:predicted MFS family arabinose efflux permease
VGLLLAGTLGDRFPRAAIATAIIFITLSLLVIGLYMSVPLVAICAIGVWGASFGALPSLLQARMMHAASVRVRDVASSYFTTSFNLAIGMGALVGGGILDGFGVGSLVWVDLVITFLGLALVLGGNVWISRRDAAYRHP